MKKRITALLLTFLIAFTFTGCGKYTCTLCGEEKFGKGQVYELLGQKATLCKDCNKSVNDILDIFK